MTTLRLLTVLLLTLGVAFAGLSVADAEDDNDLTFAVFDVADIVRDYQPARARTLGIPDLWGRFAPSRRNDKEPSTRVASIEQVVEFLHWVEPESWDSIPGADISANGDRLHVRTTKSVMEKVRAAIAALRMHAARRVLLDVDVRSGVTGFPHTDTNARSVASSSLEVPLFVERTVESTNRVRFVGEYEVEIAQGSIIANPVVEEAVGGLVAEIAAAPTLEGNQILVEGAIQYGTVDPPSSWRRVELGIDEEYIPKEYRSGELRFTHGNLELPIFRGTTVVMSALIPAGGSVDIPVAHRGAQKTIRVKANVLGGPGDPTLWPVGALTRREMGAYVHIPRTTNVEDYQGTARLHWTEKRGDEVYCTVEQLVDLLSNAIPLDSDPWFEIVGTDRIFVPMRQRGRDQARAFLLAREADVLTSVTVDVRAYSVVGDFVTGPGAAVPETDRALLAAGRVPCVTGRRSSFLAGSTAAFVADYDVEVAQEARISDPIVHQAFDGIVVNLRPHGSVGRTTALDLELLLSSRTVEDKGYASPQQYQGPIDRIFTNRTEVDTTIRVPNGGTYVIDGGADPYTKGRRLAIELRVE